MNLKNLQEIPSWEWPEDAADMILQTLLDGRAEPSARRLAAELAGDYVVLNDRLAETLLAIVGGADKPMDLRSTAAISLGPALEGADIDGFDEPDSCPISEEMFHKIQQSFHKLYSDGTVPDDVRRMILEASVRAPQDWHEAAVLAAHADDDDDWRLTAVFCMGYVRGFDRQILESLESGNRAVAYEAVCAAGNWEIQAAWPHIKRLLTARKVDKELRLAAIEAAASLCPWEDMEILEGLAASDDEDIADAAEEALAIRSEPQDSDRDDLDEGFENEEDEGDLDQDSDEDFDEGLAEADEDDSDENVH